VQSQSVASLPTPAVARDKARGRVLLLVALLTVVVLLITAGSQIYDSNLFALSEATALLAGDHPYRDFFDSGMPLAAYMSAAAQLVSGRRLIGEFVLQWIFIVAGVVLSFDLGLRVSRSAAAVLAVVPVVFLMLASTPTYHYQKLFFFPLTIWAAWRYIDHPSAGRCAALGFVTAAAFLSRHDFGIYCGWASILAWGLPRLTSPTSRPLRAVALDVAAYAAAVCVTLLPWAVVVQMNEGLVRYVQARTTLYQEPEGVRYASLLAINPFHALGREPLPEPKPAVVGFLWNENVDEAMRHQLEQRHGLRPLGSRDALGRLQYEVSNVYDLELFQLDPYISDGAGFQWNRLNDFRRHVPGVANVLSWFQQITMLVPFLLVVSGCLEIWRHRHQRESISPDAARLMLAGGFLVIVDAALLRRPTYVVIVIPVTLALGARFLAGRSLFGRGVAIAALILTTVTALVYARETTLFRPTEYGHALASGFSRLLASPPDEGQPLTRYLRECTVPGDRLLVTGSTPFNVSYYAQRPIAGGQLAWKYGWRADREHEQESLALLRRQSVPFAVSTRDPVLADLSRYPRIREYLQQNYAEVEGSQGRILVDTRRRATGRFGPEGFPCFRP